MVSFVHGIAKYKYRYSYIDTDANVGMYSHSIYSRVRAR